MVIFREGNIHFHFLFFILANKLLFKTWNKRTRTDCQRIVFPFPAFKRFSVHKAFKINGCYISVFDGSAFYFHGSGIAFSFFLDFFLNFLICHCNGLLFHLYSLILAQSYFRLQSHLCRKDKRLSGLHLCDRNFRRGNNAFLTLFQSFLIGARNQLICSVFIKHFPAVHPFNHLTGNLALSEAGNTDFIFCFLIHFLNRFFQLFR